MGFSRQDAKTPDHYFTGFPSYWNIVALYVLVADVPRTVNAVVLTILSVMVFVPIRYVYPSRTPTLRALTVTACAIWGVQVALLIWWMPDVPAGAQRVCSNDVYVDHRGLIYLIDRNRGLSILERV